MLTDIDHKIRIAHIITRMDRGGAPDIVRLLAEKCDPLRFEVTLVYGLTREPSDATRWLLASLKDRTIMVPSLRRALNPFFDVCAFFSLYRILKKGRFDLVHTHTAKAGVLGRITARLAGVRAVVHSPHGHDFYGYFGSFGSFWVVWVERWASRFCDCIHVLTQLEKGDMVVRRICPAEKIRVIASGVSAPAQDAALRAPSETSCVGFVGRFETVKGPEYFIEAAAEIAAKFPRVRFLMAGDGSLRADLEKQARRLGLGDKLTFAGWVEDVDTALRQIDILVVASLNEGVGRVILEAAARGIPSVATRVGGIPEVVRDNETGILVASRDAKGLAGAVLRLLQDTAMYRRLQEAGMRLVREEYSEGKMIAEFTHLYNELKYEA